MAKKTASKAGRRGKKLAVKPMGKVKALKDGKVPFMPVEINPVIISHY